MVVMSYRKAYGRAVIPEGLWSCCHTGRLMVMLSYRKAYGRAVIPEGLWSCCHTGRLMVVMSYRKTHECSNVVMEGI